MKKNYYNLPDFRLLIVVYIIIAFGISMVHSSSINISNKIYHDQYHLFKNQLLWLVIGTVLLMGIFNINYKYTLSGEVLSF